MADTDAVCESELRIATPHRELLDQVLDIFAIRPDFDLNLMKPGQDLSDINSNVLLGMRDVYRQWQPDIVLVHGDTTTTLAASLSAYYAKVRVGHVEAGLRTLAEGVETPEQLAFLRQHGCQLVQGYHFSKPLPPAQLLDFVRQRSSAAPASSSSTSA